METKICSRCGEEKPIQEFHWKNKQHTRLNSRCKTCYREIMGEQYHSKKEVINEIKQNLSCAKCGYDKIPSVLEFHHINPNEKDNTIARMSSNKYNIDAIMQEIDKCVCLCANCHREFHYYESKYNITIEEFLNSECNEGSIPSAPVSSSSSAVRAAVL